MAASASAAAGENSVSSLQRTHFKLRVVEEQLRVKELGADRPELDMKQASVVRGRQYTRTFSGSWYERKTWLTGCGRTNALYCFPCLLFRGAGTDVAWTQVGVTDLKHLADKCKKHEQSRSHMENHLSLALFGKMTIAAQLDAEHRSGRRNHNREVAKNRHILSKIIDYVCLDEADAPGNPGGAFRGSADFAASLGGALKEHLGGAGVFRGAPGTVQNELLACMLEVLREHIVGEIASADFLSVQVDETAEAAAWGRLALVVRYLDGLHQLQERFFEFIPLRNPTSESIAAALLERLALILPPHRRGKLICQTYDGASVMRGPTSGVQKRIQDVYENAHHVHCYAHQLSAIMQQGASQLTRVRQFFSDLGAFTVFFSRSLKAIRVLDETVAERLPRAGAVNWDFHGCAVNTVFKHKDDLVRCCEKIRNSGGFDSATIREAGGLVRLLEDADFNFLLKLFHHIMPQVDVLYALLQKRNVDSSHLQGSIQHFTENIKKIRDSLPSLCGQHSAKGPQILGKRRWSSGPGEHEKMAAEICDTILGHAIERFSFTKHLVSSTLLHAEMFEHYRAAFPQETLDIAVNAYPMLCRNKLKTELSLIYSNDEFKACRGAVDLYQFFMDNDLQEPFSETVTLLKILITTPMTTTESDRCFSTLKRMKAFLRNTMTEDRLNSLAMISMEKKLMKDMVDFNLKVVEKFSAQKHRRDKFMYTCFQVFKVVHQLVNTEEDILMVAKDVINEFAEDGVKYLELRSTPREETKTGLTKRRYIETVLEAIRQCQNEGVDIDVRFLVAVDRRNGSDVAMETVKLAEEFMLSTDGLVVGLDLSGDPTVGHGRDLLPALHRAKNSGLKLALHLSEVPSQLEESELLLSLPPDRIGHGTFLHPNMGGAQRLVDQVVKHNIPLELCLTSNIKGQTVSCYSKHHFQYWYQLGHPSVICTDDKGVFCTDLSQEYQLAASTFGLSHEDVWKLSMQAVDCTFAPHHVKHRLKRRWEDFKPHVLR